MPGFNNSHTERAIVWDIQRRSFLGGLLGAGDSPVGPLPKSTPRSFVLPQSSTILVHFGPGTMRFRRSAFVNNWRICTPTDCSRFALSRSRVISVQEIPVTARYRLL